MAGCKLRSFFCSFFSLFFFNSPITLSLWARKSDVSGADKLQSDWKVSATWVESRLGKIPICVRDEEGRRKREREEGTTEAATKDGSSRISSVRVIEIWGTRFSHGRHDLAFQGCSVSRIYTGVSLDMLFSRCNLTRLRANASQLWAKFMLRL